MVTSQLFSHNAMPWAKAAQTFAYRFQVPFEELYEESKAFKPPMRLKKNELAILATEVCRSYVSKSPRVIGLSASGKRVVSTPMRPEHKAGSASWFKDGDGENVFRFKGVCSFIAQIPRKLPDSNFYQFSADPMKVANWQTWSYPYTARQLANLKGGITETRINGGNEVNKFLPTPYIEEPIVKEIKCIPGSLLFKDEDDKDEDEEIEETEEINVAHFAIANPIYSDNSGEINWPYVWISGARQPVGDNYEYEIEYLEPSVSGSLRNAPTFAVWRKMNEESFEIDVNVSISTIAAPGRYVVVEKKSFSLSIDSQCKVGSIKSR